MTCESKVAAKRPHSPSSLLSIEKNCPWSRMTIRFMIVFCSTVLPAPSSATIWIEPDRSSSG